jgi:hypothetical protein
LPWKRDYRSRSILSGIGWLSQSEVHLNTRGEPEATYSSGGVISLLRRTGFVKESEYMKSGIIMFSTPWLRVESCDLSDKICTVTLND